MSLEEIIECLKNYGFSVADNDERILELTLRPDTCGDLVEVLGGDPDFEEGILQFDMDSEVMSMYIDGELDLLEPQEALDAMERIDF